MDPVGDDTQARWSESSLALEIPPGWVYRESYTLTAPDEHANVIASTEQIDPEMNSFDYQQIQGNLLSTRFDGYKEHSLNEIGLPGIDEPAFLREFSWTPEGGVPVTQIQLYAVQHGRGITATATTPSSLYDERRDVLLRIINSIAVRVGVLRALAGEPPR